jgi:hypothetical protein
MTDMTDPNDDEIASAHLDGATTAEERARVDGDPELQARVAALGAVRGAVHEPVPVDPAARDAAIAAALAAFDAEGAAAEASSGATVTPIAPRRSLSPAALKVVGAAAVLALLALLVPRLAGSGDDDQASFEAAGDAMSDAGGEDHAGSGEPDQESAGLSTTSAPAALGTYDSLDQLLDALEDGGARLAPAEGGAAVANPQAYDLSGCRQDPVPSSAELAGAVVGGQRVVVALVRGEDALVRVLVLDAATCELLADRDL